MPRSRCGRTPPIARRDCARCTTTRPPNYDIEGYLCHWPSAEFDNFLITCGVKYDDMREVFKGRANAAVLAPMLDQRDEQHRPLRVASEAWGSPKPGVTLVTPERELGRITDWGRTRKPPVGRRSRAREARRRRIGPERYAVLEEMAAELAKIVTADECAFWPTC